VCFGDSIELKVLHTDMRGSTVCIREWKLELIWNLPSDQIAIFNSYQSKRPSFNVENRDDNNINLIV